MSPESKKALIALIPSLRAFAMALCHNPATADDLVQDTLVKAWANFHSFQEGSNLKGWLFTILRNTYFSEWRKRKRQGLDHHTFDVDAVAVAPEQQSHIDLHDLRRAMEALPDEQREALILVGGAGYSYEEAAEICDCAIGTVKSRVNRARNRLGKLLEVKSAHDFGPDATTSATTLRMATPHR